MRRNVACRQGLLDYGIDGGMPIGPSNIIIIIIIIIMGGDIKIMISDNIYVTTMKET